MPLKHSSTPPLVLASKSPRRRELLEQIGVDYTPLTTHVSEIRSPGELPAEYVERLAREKARAGAQMDQFKRPSLGADTVVVLGDEVLEKPCNRDHGREMLMRLSGRTHVVMTAVALAHQERVKGKLVTTDVTFRLITEAEIDAYWLTGEPQDKAGAYGIQGFAAVFVERLQGSYSAVVGLPLCETAALLQEFAVPCWKTLRDKE